MFKIIKILNHGGSCPFQIDALTIDDRMIYGRYRNGYLRVFIGKTGDLSEDAAVCGERIFFKDFNKRFDGSMLLEEFQNETKEALDFSEAVVDS